MIYFEYFDSCGAFKIFRIFMSFGILRCFVSKRARVSNKFMNMMKFGNENDVDIKYEE